MALAFLLAVFGFVVLLIALFIFPPTRWVKQMEPKRQDSGNKTAPPQP